MLRNMFNLVDEPWICLLSRDGKVTKEGLKKVFLKAQDFLDLGGEIRLQDMAIMRMLIAISVTVLYRYDENGCRSDLQNWEHALNRFHSIWNMGKYNERAICEYFDTWNNRFNLFDERYPFCQIPLVGVDWKDDKEYPNGKKPVHKNGIYMNWLPIANLNGRIQRSNNKPNTPYKDISGTASQEVDFDEAARWLLFYNAFADCSVGKQQNYINATGKKESANAKMPHPSKGSLITPVGHNLFETIMLNSVLFHVNRNELYESVQPAWEADQIDMEIDFEKPVPNDLPRMYTQQARRISLFRKGDKVTGAYVSAGESYSKELLWMEPAFMMHEVKDKDKQSLILVPKQCGTITDIWREIEHIAGDKGASITIWVDKLLQYIDEDRVIPFRVTGITYGPSTCGIKSMTEDKITLSRQFLEDSDTQADALSEIKRTEEISKLLRSFGNNCARCMNLSDKDTRIGKMLVEQYYTVIGQEFRKFLSGKSSVEDLRKEEFELVRRITAQYINKNIKSLIRGKAGDKGMYLGKAEAIFNTKLSKLERK